MATGGNLDDLTSREAVLLAMSEFRKLGREKFIEKYSAPEAKFRKSKEVFVFMDGIPYDSKPLAAAAYGFQHGRNKALHSNDFYGGAPTEAVFESLGFSITRWLSPKLEKGNIYTREELRNMFNISDATINTGVFQPKGSNSIWLFVTEEKTADRTQYKDRLNGDLLKWQGQSSGRTDKRIIEHASDGNELIVFYRKKKYEYPGAGFRMEGQFQYVSHHGSKPATFELIRYGTIEDTELPTPDFDPESVEDGRKKILAEVRRRQGQRKFRLDLISAYGGRCAISGCPVVELLEAAHIRPYLGNETNHVQNGLLLRADLHTLFDLGLLALELDGRISVSSKLKETDYWKFKGEDYLQPSNPSKRPSPKAIKWHRECHGWP